MEGQEKLKESAHEKALLHLLESSNTGTRPFNDIPKSQDSVKIAMGRAAKGGLPTKNKFLMNSIGDNSILDRKFLGNEISFDRGATGKLTIYH